MIDALLVLGAFLCGLPAGMFLGLFGCVLYIERQHDRQLDRIAQDSPYAEHVPPATGEGW